MQEFENLITEIFNHSGNDLKELQKNVHAVIEEQEKSVPTEGAKLRMIAWDQN